MQTIEAAVLYGPQELEIQEVKLDAPRPNEVCVNIKSTGVCRSDFERYEGRGDVPYPIVLGHEGSGIVESVGSAVSTVSPGDHVVLSVMPSCGVCVECEGGSPYRCNRGADIAFSGTLFDGTRRLSVDGSPVNHFFAQSSFATKAVVPERSAVPIREDIAFEKAALLGCGATTGLGAVFNTGNVEPGDSVAVFGCGGVGSSALLAADAIGCHPIIAVDLEERKRSRAKEFGATHSVDAGSESVVKEIHNICDSGVKHAFEFAGVTTAMEQAIASTRPGGEAVISGSTPEDAQISINPRVLLKDRTVQGNIAGSLRPRIDIPRFADMCATGSIALGDLLSDTYPLRQLEDAFEALESNSVIRTAIVFE